MRRGNAAIAATANDMCGRPDWLARPRAGANGASAAGSQVASPAPGAGRHYAGRGIVETRSAGQREWDAYGWCGLAAGRTVPPVSILPDQPVPRPVKRPSCPCGCADQVPVAGCCRCPAVASVPDPTRRRSGRPPAFPITASPVPLSPGFHSGGAVRGSPGINSAAPGPGTSAKGRFSAAAARAMSLLPCRRQPALPILQPVLCRLPRRRSRRVSAEMPMPGRPRRRFWGPSPARVSSAPAAATCSFRQGILWEGGVGRGNGSESSSRQSRLAAEGWAGGPCPVCGLRAARSAGTKAGTPSPAWRGRGQRLPRGDPPLSEAREHGDRLAGAVHQNELMQFGVDPPGRRQA